MSPIKALTMKDYENVSDLYQGYIVRAWLVGMDSMQ